MSQIAEKQIKNRTNHLATYWESGGNITQASGTQINISAGSGYFYDINTKQSILYSWSDISNLTLNNIASGYDASYIMIDKTGTIAQLHTLPEGQNMRDKLYLGKISHRAGSNISNILNIKVPIDFSVHFYDHVLAEGGSKNRSGNVFSANGANLQLNKTAGTSFRVLANSDLNLKDPHTTTEAILTGLTLNRVYRNGTGGLTYQTTQTTIAPAQWDNGSGTLQNVPSNNWTIQRIYLFPRTNSVYVWYGQNTYPTQTDAVNAIYTELFNDNFDFFEGSVLRAFLVVKNTATALNDTNQAKIIENGTGSGSSGGGGSTGDMLKSTYDPNNDGIIDFANGGTGQTTRQLALNALAGATTVNRFLKGDGTNIGLSQVLLNTNDVAGILPITLGGTGGNTKTSGFNGLSPLTTKGDLIVRDSTNNIRFGVGSPGQGLICDPTTASGLRWASSPLTNKGDLLTHDGTSPLRLGVGTRGQVLTVNPDYNTGMNWEDVPNIGIDFTYFTEEFTSFKPDLRWANWKGVNSGAGTISAINPADVSREIGAVILAGNGAGGKATIVADNCFVNCINDFQPEITACFLFRPTLNTSHDIKMGWFNYLDGAFLYGFRLKKNGTATEIWYYYEEDSVVYEALLTAVTGECYSEVTISSTATSFNVNNFYTYTAFPLLDISSYTLFPAFEVNNTSTSILDTATIKLKTLNRFID